MERRRSGQGFGCWWLSALGSQFVNTSRSVVPPARAGHGRAIPPTADRKTGQERRQVAMLAARTCPRHNKTVALGHVVRADQAGQAVVRAPGQRLPRPAAHVAVRIVAVGLPARAGDRVRAHAAEQGIAPWWALTVLTVSRWSKCDQCGAGILSAIVAPAASKCWRTCPTSGVRSWSTTWKERASRSHDDPRAMA